MTHLQPHIAQVHPNPELLREAIADENSSLIRHVLVRRPIAVAPCTNRIVRRDHDGATLWLGCEGIHAGGVGQFRDGCTDTCVTKIIVVSPSFRQRMIRQQRNTYRTCRSMLVR